MRLATLISPQQHLLVDGVHLDLERVAGDAVRMVMTRRAGSPQTPSAPRPRKRFPARLLRTRWRMSSSFAADGRVGIEVGIEGAADLVGLSVLPVWSARAPREYRGRPARASIITTCPPASGRRWRRWSRTPDRPRRRVPSRKVRLHVAEVMATALLRPPHAQPSQAQELLTIPGRIRATIPRSSRAMRLSSERVAGMGIGMHEAVDQDLG